jgi:hypothetical protein
LDPFDAETVEPRTGTLHGRAADVFQFMVVRAPELPAGVQSKRNLIRDDMLTRNGRVDRDLFSIATTSAIGRLI